jgi:hypothetical protein
MGPGPVAVGAGSSSDGMRSGATFSVTGQTCTINSEERAFLSETTIG